MLGPAIGLAAGVLELALSGVWLHLLRQVRIPDDRRLFLAGHAVALGLGVAALALGAGTPGAVFGIDLYVSRRPYVRSTTCGVSRELVVQEGQILVGPTWGVCADD